MSLAIAGAGSIAAVHALAARSAGIEITAVASRAGRSARHLAGQVDARRVGTDALPAGADLLVVATPPDTHERFLVQGLSAGARVLVEKPLTTTLASADRMVEASHKPDAPLALVAENLLASPYWRAALEHRRGGGPLTHLSARAIQPPPNWGHFLGPLEAGGVLFDLGPHPVSLVLGLADKPVVGVSARLTSTRPDGADDDAEVEIRFVSDLVARIKLSWTSTSTQWSLQAASPDRVVRLEFIPETVLEVNGEPVQIPTRHDVVDPRFESLGYVDQLLAITSDPAQSSSSADPSSDLSMLRGQPGNADAPADANLQENRDPRRLGGQSLEDARLVLEIICAAYQSAGSGGDEVALPFAGNRELTPMQLWQGTYS